MKVIEADTYEILETVTLTTKQVTVSINSSMLKIEDFDSFIILSPKQVIELKIFIEENFEFLK